MHTRARQEEWLNGRALLGACSSTRVCASAFLSPPFLAMTSPLLSLCIQKRRERRHRMFGLKRRVLKGDDDDDKFFFRLHVPVNDECRCRLRTWNFAHLVNPILGIFKIVGRARIRLGANTLDHFRRDFFFQKRRRRMLMSASDWRTWNFAHLFPIGSINKGWAKGSGPTGRRIKFHLGDVTALFFLGVPPTRTTIDDDEETKENHFHGMCPLLGM